VEKRRRKTASILKKLKISIMGDVRRLERKIERAGGRPI